MATDVDIANRALSMLGEKRITALTDDNKAGRAMNARYSFLRDSELAAYPWRFAIRRIKLYASGAAPDWGYSTVYALPADNLRTIKVGGDGVNAQAVGVMYESSGYSSGARAAYEIIEGELHTNLSSPVEYEYIAQITDTTKFDPLFIEALAARIAADAAEELTQSDSKKKYAIAIYDDTLRTARRSDALRRPPRERAAGRWHRSRSVV